MSNLADQLLSTMTTGVEHMDLGEFEKALQCFLLVLDSGFSSRNGEFFELRWHLGRLSHEYQPTLEALSNRRDDTINGGAHRLMLAAVK